MKSINDISSKLKKLKEKNTTNIQPNYDAFVKITSEGIFLVEKEGTFDDGKERTITEQDLKEL